MGPGIAGMAMFLDPENSMNLVWACVGLVIAVVASFVVTFIIYKDEGTVDASLETETAPSTSATPVASLSASTVVSPLMGRAILLTEVKDEVFATGVLGNGAAVIPEKGELYAPADGTIETVFDSKHAISMVTDAGVELLMHVGMDTVQLEGKGYSPLVKNGEKVKKGQLIMKFDIASIKAAGYDVTTPVVITNSDAFTIKFAAEGTIVPGAALMELEVAQ